MSHNYTYEESVKRLLNEETLNEKEIRNILWESTQVYNEVLDHGRWQITMFSVVEVEGALFGIVWYKGNTDSQEDDYPCQPERVEAYTETVTKYRLI